MNFDSWFNIESHHPPPGSEKATVSSSHYLSIYVIFSILLKIRKQIGLEAMLEYIRKYMEKFEKHYPRKQSLVKQQIHKVDVIKMYQDGMEQ